MVIPDKSYLIFVESTISSVDVQQYFWFLSLVPVNGHPFASMRLKKKISRNVVTAVSDSAAPAAGGATVVFLRPSIAIK
jgi:hypothetical protein